MIRVFLGGEGVDELGRFAHAPAYAVDSSGKREVEKGPGIIEALAERLKGQPLEFVGGLAWHRIRKRKGMRGVTAAEARNVVGLALDAKDAGCDAVVFVRDQDGQGRRAADVEEGIHAARERCPDLRIIGGMAVEEIEAWLLAMLGERNSESHRRPEEVLRDRRGIANRYGKTRVVEEADFDKLPEDALSLRRWMNRFESTLAPSES
jgi:hypothetical protein